MHNSMLNPISWGGGVSIIEFFVWIEYAEVYGTTFFNEKKKPQKL